MQDSEQLAQIAYESFRKEQWWGRKALNLSPAWNDLGAGEQNAWVSAAQAVKANVLSGFTHVGEGESP